MRALIVGFVFLTTTMARAQSYSHETFCPLVKRDTMDLRIFWEDHPKVHALIKSDTNATTLIWIERLHGSKTSNLAMTNIQAIDNVVIRFFINDGFKKVDTVFYDGFASINLLKLAQNYEFGNYGLICPKSTANSSTNAFFIFEKGSQKFALFTGMDFLSAVPSLDRAIAINAIALLESVFSKFNTSLRPKPSKKKH